MNKTKTLDQEKMHLRSCTPMIYQPHLMVLEIESGEALKRFRA